MNEEIIFCLESNEGERAYMNKDDAIKMIMNPNLKFTLHKSFHNVPNNEITRELNRLLKEE